MKQKRKQDKRARGWISLISAIAALVMAMSVTVMAQPDPITVAKEKQKITEQVFRLHIVANSDRVEDQELKLKVRDGILAYMRERLPEMSSARETAQWAQTNQIALHAVAQRIVHVEKVQEEIQLSVGMATFPEKQYGDITLPAGNYQALRIVIGEGKGHNWWCVLYPNLCFLDATHGVVPKEGKEKLRQVLAEEEYDMLLHPEHYRLTTYLWKQRTEN